jgi:hypothetical protein
VTSEADDAEVLDALAGGNGWLRAVLCTLARRGTSLRREEPERAARLLEALSPWPWFKGGQFLFDLLELEDFMVDGPAPPVLPTTLDAVALQRITERLREFRALLDGAVGSMGQMPGGLLEEVSVVADAEVLPPLEPGLHLYRDVVLGAVASAGPVLRARRTGQE